MPEVPLVMPKMSMTMVEGEVIGWRKQAGDPVRAGEVVCEVLTDKVDMEVEAPVDGVLDRIVAEPPATVPVGQPLAFIRTDADDLLAGLLDPAEPTGPASATGPVDEADPPPSAGADTGAAPAAAPPPAPEPTAPAASSASSAASRPTPPSRQGPKPALPGARRRAGELGVRLDDVAGSGPSGAVTLADVERVAAAETQYAGGNGSPGPGGDPVAPSTGDARTSGVDPGFADALAARRRSVRAAVARTMAASAAVPQFTLFADLDLAALDRDRAGVGWTTLLIRAFAAALREHTELNAAWSEHGPRSYPFVGIAVAVDTPVGLLAPVIRDPDLRPLAELDSEVRRTVQQARSGRLAAADLADATATVSNLGGFGVEAFQALLTPPQATVLSVGRIGPRPVALAGGGLVARVGCTVGLTVDHRVADGADAGRLLADLAALVTAPTRLLAHA